MAGIVFRIDKKPFSEEIEGVYAFCSECDPEGVGGGPGVLGQIPKCDYWDRSSDLVTEFDVESFAKYHRFCPTCGKKINYSARITTMITMLPLLLMDIRPGKPLSQMTMAVRK